MTMEKYGVTPSGLVDSLRDEEHNLVRQIMELHLNLNYGQSEELRKLESKLSSVRNAIYEHDMANKKDSPK